MPSRSNKLRWYTTHARKYVASEPALVRLMAADLSNRTPEQHLADLTLTPSNSREQLMDRTLTGIISEVESNRDTCGLRQDTILLILSLLNPLITPIEVDRSPVAKNSQQKSIPPKSSPQKTASPPQSAVVTIQPFVPAKPITPIVSPEPVEEPQSVSDSKKRPISRGPSRFTRPPKRSGFVPLVPEQAIRSASPTMGLVPVISPLKSISMSELEKDDEFVDDFGLPGDELPSSDVDKRMTYWQLHGHRCLICSWIARFFLIHLTPTDRVPQDTRKNMITFHVFGELDAMLNYRDIKEGMQSAVFVDDKVNLPALADYIARNNQ